MCKILQSGTRLQPQHPAPPAAPVGRRAGSAIPLVPLLAGKYDSGRGPGAPQRWLWREDEAGPTFRRELRRAPNRAASPSVSTKETSPVAFPSPSSPGATALAPAGAGAGAEALAAAGAWGHRTCPCHARAMPAPPKPKTMPIARATPAPCPRHCSVTPGGTGHARATPALPKAKMACAPCPRQCPVLPGAVGPGRCIRMARMHPNIHIWPHADQIGNPDRPIS
eukprot:gene15464-biopygen23191